MMYGAEAVGHAASREQLQLLWSVHIHVGSKGCQETMASSLHSHADCGWFFPLSSFSLAHLEH